jgi:hypothetical protein
MMAGTVKAAVNQANWADIRERSFWTGVQTALGYLSAEAVLLALEAAGVDIPDGWVYPLTIVLAAGISVVKNVVKQYLDSFEIIDLEEAEEVVIDDVTPVSVEDAYAPPTDEPPPVEENV